MLVPTTVIVPGPSMIERVIPKVPFETMIEPLFVTMLSTNEFFPTPSFVSVNPFK